MKKPVAAPSIDTSGTYTGTITGADWENVTGSR
jgi:hypothetical protein